MFTNPQVETQEEFNLRMNLGVEQAEHRKAAGDPRLVFWIPKGMAQVALH